MSKVAKNNQIPQKNRKTRWNEKKWKVHIKKDGNSFCLFDNLDGTNAMLRVKTLRKMCNGWRGKLLISR